jgi:hypothetical protein
LCQPRVIVKMIVEKQMECRLAGETEVIGENLPQRHFCPSQNLTWPVPGLKPRLRGGKPATNSLSYGAAIRSYLVRNISIGAMELSIEIGRRHFVRNGYVLHWKDSWLKRTHQDGIRSSQNFPCLKNEMKIISGLESISTPGRLCAWRCEEEPTCIDASSAFRSVTPCNLGTSRCFGETYRVYRQGRRVHGVTTPKTSPVQEPTRWNNISFWIWRCLKSNCTFPMYFNSQL